MSQYQDIYMRDNLSDTGQVPDVTNVSWTSPDIIPSGTTPVSNPQQFFSSNWTQDVGQNLASGQVNYIYVRGMNKYSGAETGTIQIYYVPSSLLPNSPQWINNIIYTANQSQTTAVSATATNQVVVGQDAFQWTPPAPPSGFHYCLLAIVGTPNNAPPLPPATGFGSSAAFVSWVLDNPSVAWRNVTIVPYPPPPTWQQSQSFSNLDSTDEEYLFQVNCAGLPVGAVVSFSCSASGPQPPINATLTVPPNPPSSLWLSQTSLLRSGFSSTLELTFQIPTGQPVPNVFPQVEFGRVTTGSDSPELRKYSRVLTTADRPDLTANLEVVILGSCTIEFQAGGQSASQGGA